MFFAGLLLGVWVGMCLAMILVYWAAGAKFTYTLVRTSPRSKASVTVSNGGRTVNPDPDQGTDYARGYSDGWCDAAGVVEVDFGAESAA